MHIPESAHLWTLFAAGHGLHVLKRASLSATSRLSGTKTRAEWLRTNALSLAIRLFVKPPRSPTGSRIPAPPRTSSAQPA
jgi:hypothetical protein